MRLGFAVSFRAPDHRKHIAGIKPWYGFQNQGFGGGNEKLDNKTGGPDCHYALPAAFVSNLPPAYPATMWARMRFTHAAAGLHDTQGLGLPPARGSPVRRTSIHHLVLRGLSFYHFVKEHTKKSPAGKELAHLGAPAGLDPCLK